MPSSFPGGQLNSCLLPEDLLRPATVLWKKPGTLFSVSQLKEEVEEWQSRDWGREDLLPHPSGKFLVPPGQWLLGLVPLELPLLWNGGDSPPCPGGRP